MSDMPLDAQAADDLLKQIVVTMDYHQYAHLVGGQFKLWRQMSVSDSELHAETIRQLQGLSDKAGGWWYFSDASASEADLGGGQFVSLEQWETINARQDDDVPETL